MCIESISEHFVPCVTFILDVSLLQYQQHQPIAGISHAALTICALQEIA
jgi:hypothetical protein